MPNPSSWLCPAVETASCGNPWSLRAKNRAQYFTHSLLSRHFPLDFAFYSLILVAMALTKRQRQVYDYIAEFVQKNGYSPSFEEIGDGMGLSSLATVHKHITNLEKKGLLRRDYNRSRSLDILAPRGKMKQAFQSAATAADMAAAQAAMAAATLPLVGRIAAGRPVETLQ